MVSIGETCLSLATTEGQIKINLGRKELCMYHGATTKCSYSSGLYMYIFYRVLLMCQQSDAGISDAQLSSVLPDLDMAARVGALNRLLKLVRYSGIIMTR